MLQCYEIALDLSPTKGAEFQSETRSHLSSSSTNHSERPLMQPPTKQAKNTRFLLDNQVLSPGSSPTRIKPTVQAPVHKVTQRITGFWVDGKDLSQIEDTAIRGGECDTTKFLVARSAASASSTVRVPQGPIHISWAGHLSSHLSDINPAITREINLPQFVLRSISDKIVSLLEKIFEKQYTNIGSFLAFVVSRLRLRRQEVEVKYKSMKTCKLCLESSNTAGDKNWYLCHLRRELKEDLLANDEKLIQVLHETVAILEDASHPDNPLAPYPVLDLREGGVETFVLAAFLIALGESEGHTENHARLAIDILSAALPRDHKYLEYMNLDFLDRAMAELHGYRRSYVKFPL